MVNRVANRTATAFVLLVVVLLAAGPFFASGQISGHQCCSHSIPLKSIPANCCVVAPHNSDVALTSADAPNDFLATSTAVPEPVVAAIPAMPASTAAAPKSPPGRSFSLRI